MRKEEWISLIALSFFTIACFFRQLTAHKRIGIVATGAIGIVLITAPQFAGSFISPFALSIVRDWLPALLMPMVYWQAGWFSSPVNSSFQEKLRRLDHKLLGSWMPLVTARPGFRWVAAALELAYISCYVLVPMGLAVLYLEDLERHSTTYWFVVMIATYPCYVFTAFRPTYPPRLIEKVSVDTVTGKMRRFNLWIVRSMTTQLNTFPSAHVTATLGGSLVLLNLVPSIGLLFVLISIGIALGAVHGRYHYAADVLLAVALTVAAYVVAMFLN